MAIDATRNMTPPATIPATKKIIARIKLTAAMKSKAVVCEGFPLTQSGES